MVAGLARVTRQQLFAKLLVCWRNGRLASLEWRLGINDDRLAAPHTEMMATAVRSIRTGKREFRSSRGSASIAAIASGRKTSDVEHAVPKEHNKQLETDWSNFLLACRNCNGRKWRQDTLRKGCLWSGEDDSFVDFSHRSGGRVSVAEGLEPDERSRANELLDLVGLGARITDPDR